MASFDCKKSVYIPRLSEDAIAEGIELEDWEEEALEIHYDWLCGDPDNIVKTAKLTRPNCSIKQFYNNVTDSMLEFIDDNRCIAHIIMDNNGKITPLFFHYYTDDTFENGSCIFSHNVVRYLHYIFNYIEEYFKCLHNKTVTDELYIYWRYATKVRDYKSLYEYIILLKSLSFFKYAINNKRSFDKIN